jgi:hypothetical protein
MKKPLSEKRAKAILDKLSREATDCTILKSLSYGDVEAWNLATCYLQNVEMDKVSVLGYMGSALCYETDSVQSYFRALGFTF